jgi:hypothetical protein
MSSSSLERDNDHDGSLARPLLCHHATIRDPGALSSRTPRTFTRNRKSQYQRHEGPTQAIEGSQKTAASQKSSLPSETHFPSLLFSSLHHSHLKTPFPLQTPDHHSHPDASRCTDSPFNTAGTYAVIHTRPHTLSRLLPSSRQPQVHDYHSLESGRAW